MTQNYKKIYFQKKTEFSLTTKQSRKRKFRVWSKKISEPQDPVSDETGKKKDLVREGKFKEDREE